MKVPELMQPDFLRESHLTPRVDCQGSIAGNLRLYVPHIDANAFDVLDWLTLARKKVNSYGAVLQSSPDLASMWERATTPSLDAIRFFSNFA